MGKSTFHMSTINISNGFFSQLNYIKMRVSMRINLLFVRLYLSNARMIDGNPVYCSLFFFGHARARACDHFAYLFIPLCTYIIKYTFLFSFYIRKSKTKTYYFFACAKNLFL